MKKSMKIILVSFLLLVNVGLLFSQQTRIELGDKHFDEFAYKKAIRLYSEAIKKGTKNLNVHAKLGDCYYNLAKPKKAIEKYEDAGMPKKENVKPIRRLKYALSLQSVGRENDALEEFKKYYEDSENISIRSVEKNRDSIEHLSINYPDSTASNFGTYIYDNTLYFASSRKNPAKRKRLNKRLYKWHDQPYLDIYEAEIFRVKDRDSFAIIPAELSKISDSINTVAHQATVAITQDGQTMYYSGGETNNNKLKHNKRGTSNLKLQRARLVNNKWLPDPDKNALASINLENYSIGNPALGFKDKRLFFVTCAPFPKAKGQTDIYYVDIINDSTFSKVKNVPGINTGGRESFPFFSEDGSLYFSSDGIYKDSLGIGLLDIYKVENIDEIIDSAEMIEKGDMVVDVIHMGPPFNSEKDDFAFFEPKSEEGNDCSVYNYFSSNREDSDDDIYRVKVKRKKTIRGTISDLKTGTYIADALVQLIDSTGKIEDTLQLSSSGSFSFEVSCDQTFSLRGSKERYDDSTVKNIDPALLDASNNEIKLKLKPFPCEIKLEPIIFEKDEYIISPKEEWKFKPLLELLLANRDLRIRIESHTDSRDPEIANLVLSQNRAESTRDYLIEKGVDRNQILSAVGLGENCPLNTDAYINNLATQIEKEDAHRKNRRSRFILEDCEEYASDCQEEDP